MQPSNAKARAESWLREASWATKLLVPVIVGQAILAGMVALNPAQWTGMDWRILTEAGNRITAGLNPYDVQALERLRFSPLLAHFFALITPIGMIGWTLLSFALLAVLRDWRLIGLFLVSLPFWIDIVTGMTFLPVPILAIAALRGSFSASLAFVALAALIPRPMMLPILGWLLWQQPRLRVPAVLTVVGLTLGAFATGWGVEWVTDLVRVARSEDARPILQLAAFLGPFWVLLMLLGGWLATRGRLGFAALAVSPYWNPSYFMLLMVEAVRPRTRTVSPIQPEMTQNARSVGTKRSGSDGVT
jgi:hypothetical protein